MVEGARLERVYMRNHIEGSNPSLSAIYHKINGLYKSLGILGPLILLADFSVYYLPFKLLTLLSVFIGDWYRGGYFISLLPNMVFLSREIKACKL